MPAPLLTICAASLVLLASAFVACGAAGERAPVVLEARACPTIEEQIPTLLAMLEDGRLLGLQEVLQEGMSESLRGELVELTLALLRSFPPETLDGLRRIAESDDVWALLPLVADVLRFIAEDGGGRWEVLPPATRMLALCDGKDLLELAHDALLDATMLDAVTLMMGDRAALTDLLAALDLDLSDPAARDAVLALLDNITASFVAPGFQLDELERLLAELGEQGLVDLGSDGIRGLLALAHELLDPPGNLSVLQGFVGCLRTVDEERALTGLLFDLAAAGAVDLDDLEAVIRVTDPAVGGDVLLGLLAQALRFLVDDDEARSSLVTILLSVLGEDAARRAVPDLVELLDAGAVPEVVDLLVALVYGCDGSGPAFGGAE